MTAAPILARRAALGAGGAATAVLLGCTAREPGPGAPSTPTGSVATGASGSTSPDPDRVALDRALTITRDLAAEVAAGGRAVDPGGRFAALHATHLAALTEAAGPTPSGSATATEPPTRPLAPKAALARLRRHEAGAQRELARLARSTASGALARLLAGMSAGIAAHLAVGPGPAP